VQQPHGLAAAEPAPGLGSAAARGDNELINYLVSKNGDVKVVSRQGQTTADMANGPVQRRVRPWLSPSSMRQRRIAKSDRLPLDAQKIAHELNGVATSCEQARRQLGLSWTTDQIGH